MREIYPKRGRGSRTPEGFKGGQFEKGIRIAAGHGFGFRGHGPIMHTTRSHVSGIMEPAGGPFAMRPLRGMARLPIL